MGLIKLDKGSYPLNPPAGGQRNDDGLIGSEVLYAHLSGDRYSGSGSSRGKPAPNGIADIAEDENSTVEAYVNNLAEIEGAQTNPARSMFAGGKYLVIDAYGDPIRYLAEAPNITDRTTINPTYDIWSLGGVDDSGELSDEEIEGNYIKNW